MPDLEISRLPQLTGADLQGTDPIALADISASETKKLTVKDLLAKGVEFIDDDTIKGDQILSLDGSKLLPDSVTATEIAADAVGASELADDAVDTAAIVDAAVTDAKLASGIDGAKLTDATVTDDKITALSGSKITDGTISSDELADDSVGSSELADDAVDTAAIKDLAVTNAKLAGSIEGTKLSNSTITSTQLADDSVGSSELADDSVDTAAVIDDAITDIKIASGINGSKLTDGTVTDDKISGLNGSKLTADSVTATQLAEGSVGSSELADGSVDTAAVIDAAITDVKLATGISGGKLTAGSVDTAQLADASVTTIKILDEAVSDDKIAEVNGSKITAETITNTQLASDSVETSNIVNDAVTNVKLASGIDGIKLLDGTVRNETLSSDAVDTVNIVDEAVTNDKLATGIDGGKLTKATVADSALGAVTDRGLDQETGKIGITNFVTAGTQGGISWDEQGLITGASGSVPSGDLPVATTSSIGAVSVPVDGGLAVTSAGAISIANTIVASTVRGIEYDEHGSIISIDAAIPESSIPIATNTAIGGVKAPGPDINVLPDGSLILSNSGVTAGTYPKVGVSEKGIVTFGTGLSASDIPSIDADKITSGELGESRIADRSIRNTKMADYSTVLIQEGTPPGTDHYTGQFWYRESDAQLRTWSGNSWISVGFGRLSQENLRFCGTFDAATGTVEVTTQFGLTAGLKAGDPVPTATDALTGVYLVCTTVGTFEGDTYDNGDWTVCLGETEGWGRVDTVNGGGGSSTLLKLGDLLDVTLTNSSAGDTLIYDETANQWVNRPTASRKANFLESFDGARTSFTLTEDAPSVNNLLISLGGILQEPGTDFAFTSPRTVNFAFAPITGLDYWIIIEGIPTTGGGGGGGGGTSLPPGTAANELLQWSSSLSSWQPTTQIDGGSF